MIWLVCLNKAVALLELVAVVVRSAKASAMAGSTLIQSIQSCSTVFWQFLESQNWPISLFNKTSQVLNKTGFLQPRRAKNWSGGPITDYLLD